MSWYFRVGDGAAGLGTVRAAAFLLFAGMSFLIGVGCGYRSGEQRVYRIEAAAALRYHPLASRRIMRRERERTSRPSLRTGIGFMLLLRRCHECGQPLGKKDVFCPRCGARQPREPKRCAGRLRGAHYLHGEERS
jgi:hypothetical protein